jgi:hypothetical protein
MKATTQHLPRVASAGLLFGALVAPLIVPFFGVLASISTLLLAPALGPGVWPGITRRRATGYTFLALMTFWVLPILSFNGVGDLSSGWFIIPLCGPASTVAWLVPTGAALLVYAIGCVVSVRRALPVAWVAAAALAMVAYEVLLAASGDMWVC